MSEPENVATSSQALVAGMIPQPYKSLLIQHAQKVWKQQPLYQTINEGSGHAPKFRCTVLVDGVSYRSPDTFQQRKTAEMVASRIAYFDLLQKLKNEALRLVREDKSLCKSVLVDFAVKMNMQKPTYQTAELNKLPVFSSSLVFGDVSCTGDYSRSKKEAEQSAARAVILKYIDSESGIILSEIIKSRYKHYTKMMDLQSAHNDTNAVLQHGTLNGLNSSLEIGRTQEASTPALTAATLVPTVLAHATGTLNDTNEVVQTGTVNGPINSLDAGNIEEISTPTLTPAITASTILAQSPLVGTLNGINEVVQPETVNGCSNSLEAELIQEVSIPALTPAIWAPTVLTQTLFAGTHNIPTYSISAPSLGQLSSTLVSHPSNLENSDTSPVIVNPISMVSPAVAQTNFVGPTSGKKPNSKKNVPTYTVMPAPSLGQVASIPATNFSNVVQSENSEASSMTVHPLPASSPAVAQMDAVGTTSSKKRSCKIKRNARKKTRVDIESPIAAIPLNQIPPFSAQ